MLEQLSGHGSYETGKLALKDAVLADGGLMGLFHRLRDPERYLEHLAKYDILLEAAISPEDCEANALIWKEHQASDGALEPLDQDFMEIAATPGLAPDDVTAMLAAYKICQTAFPDIPPADLESL